MKLADVVIETHSRGISDNAVTQFTISQNAKMFKILSDSLYSDKIQAVIRELATNAYDSHISAGNKNPFKVTLPTAANPNFSVRDYGTGLNQQDMESLYTTYGASSKNDSNDFVGCLGLGSKSPFAYTKSFTTTSYFEGKQHTYIAAIDDAGVPTLNLIHSTDTNEPNGLEIGFAVKSFDFQEFTDKAKRIFHYFKMKPILEGGVESNLSNHQYSNTNIVISGEGWRVCRLNNDNHLFPNNYRRIESGVIAIMGNIAYPVQVSHIIGEDKQEQPFHIVKWNRAFHKSDIDSWKSFVSEAINSGLYLELDFGIGELEMDVSREGLQYTKDVVKTLRQKTQEIYLEMKKEFTQKISTAKNKVEAITTYHQMNNLSGGWGVGATLTDCDGKAHNINSGEDLDYKLADGKNLYVFNYKSAAYKSRRLVCLTDRIYHNTITGVQYNYWNGQKKNGKIAFFVCDVKSEESAKKIITKYCNLNDCFAYMMLDSKDYTKSNEGFSDLIKDVGEENIFKVSDYKHLSQSSTPRKKSVSNSNGAVSDQDVFYIYGAPIGSADITIPYNDAHYLKMLDTDNLSKFLESDEIVYIPITRYKTTDGFGCPQISSIHSISEDNNLCKKIFNKTKIYAIKSSFADKLINRGYPLVTFNDFFKRKLKEIAPQFKAVSEYCSIVDECRNADNATDNEQGQTYHYYRYGKLADQYAFHMLNIFGLDYQKYINNEKLVKVIDQVLIRDFFAVTIHKQKFDLVRFNETDYYAHMNKVLEFNGIDNIDSKQIARDTLNYNSLIYWINQRLYPTEHNEYSKIVKSSGKNTFKLIKNDDLKKMVKEEVDNNPMLKYILGSRQVEGDLRHLKATNLLDQIDDRSNYSKEKNDWWVKFDDNSVDLFRIQLSSLIK